MNQSIKNFIGGVALLAGILGIFWVFVLQPMVDDCIEHTVTNATLSTGQACNNNIEERRLSPKLDALCKEHAENARRRLEVCIREDFRRYFRSYVVGHDENYLYWQIFGLIITITAIIAVTVYGTSTYKTDKMHQFLLQNAVAANQQPYFLPASAMFAGSLKEAPNQPSM
jgi:hypothetical protein